jgi:hypothetical protein
MDAVERIKSLGIKNDDLALITYYNTDGVVAYSSIFKIEFFPNKIEGTLIHQLQHTYFWKEGRGTTKTWYNLGKIYDVKKIKKEENPEYFI